jgi:fused signal recognition particle receptor
MKSGDNMQDGKKSGFFSWFNKTIRKKKDLKDEPKKDLKKQIENSHMLSNLIIQKTNKINKDDNQICNIKNQFIEKNNVTKIETRVLNNVKIIKNTPRSFFARLKNGLKKTKKFFGDGINHIFLLKHVDDVLFEELEEKMLLADIGLETTEQIISNLIKDSNRKDLKTAEKVYFLLKKNMYDILKHVEKPLKVSPCDPFVILVVGVNGTGKTTTVVKLAKKYQLEGKSVMLAAADTFRAAGIEQLQVLGKLNKITVIAQHFGSDPAAVVFDAIQSAKSKNIDVLIIDTAGRLHNKSHLLEELKKIVRVIKKIHASAPHETILVLDACNGQNTIQQTEIFHKALHITGIIITKLDGTAKGGVVFSLANQFKIPIPYIGIGEKTEDLGVFSSQEFIDAIFDNK